MFATVVPPIYRDRLGVGQILNHERVVTQFVRMAVVSLELLIHYSTCEEEHGYESFESLQSVRRFQQNGIVEQPDELDKTKWWQWLHFDIVEMNALCRWQTIVA